MPSLTPNDSQASAAPRAEIRPRAVHLLHLMVLACLAFAQQLLDLLSRTPEFLVIRGFGPLDATVLAAVLCFAPGALLALLVAGLRLGSRRLAWSVHLALVAGLATLVFLQIVKNASRDGLWPLAVASGLLFVWLYQRYAPVQQFLALLSPALLVVPLLFLLDGGVQRAVSGAGSAGTELHASGARSPIVFVVFDEWSFASLVDDEGNLDRQRLPNLAAFADQATWVRGATAASDVTEIALPAILSGRIPQKELLPTARDHPRNLFTLFGDYRVQAIEPITQLCPPELNQWRRTASAPLVQPGGLAADLAVVWLHLVVPAPFDVGLPSVSQGWRGFLADTEPESTGAAPATAEDLVAKARVKLSSRKRDAEFHDFVAAMQATPQSSLYFGHFLLPHVPLEYLPTGRRYLTQGAHLPGIYKDRWQTDPWLPTQAFHRYLLQVQYLDGLLGEMFAHLRDVGIYDQALVVLMADHGASFRPGVLRRLYAPENAPDIVPIPLFFKAPGQRKGRVVETPVSAVDVLPTLLETLGVTPPLTLDGRSFASEEAAESRTLPVVTKYSGRVDVTAKTRGEWEEETVRHHARLRAIYDGRIVPPELDLHRELIGRGVAELPSATTTGHRARIDGASAYRHLDRRDAVSLAWVSGAITGPGAACCPTLAVAVDGRITATTRAYEQPGGGVHFAALLPDDAFTSATTRLNVLEVGESGGQLALVPLGGLDDKEYRLELEPSGAIRSLAFDGGTLPLAGRIDGYVQRTVVTDNSVTVGGWAVDLEGTRLVQEVLLFYRGALVSRGVTSLPREAVVKSLGNKDYFNSGFELTFPLALASDVPRYGIRAVALTESGKAGELGLFYDRIVQGPQSEYVGVTDGREIPLGTEGMAGEISSVEERNGQTWLVGWAADVAQGAPAERVVLFLDGHYSTQLQPGLERPGVASRFGDPGLLECGFNSPADPDTRQRLRSGRLRIIAISRRTGALELRVRGAHGSPASSAGAAPAPAPPAGREGQ